MFICPTRSPSPPFPVNCRRRPTRSCSPSVQKTSVSLSFFARRVIVAVDDVSACRPSLSWGTLAFSLFSPSLSVGKSSP